MKMTQKILTCEELYQNLICLDKERRMYRENAEGFGINLNGLYDIFVYDNDGEVYLEYRKNGKQATHYHPDYQEAYEDLAEVLANPHKVLEELEKNRKSVNRRTAVVLIIGTLLLLAALLFGSTASDAPPAALTIAS